MLCRCATPVRLPQMDKSFVCSVGDQTTGVAQRQRREEAMTYLLETKPGFEKPRVPDFGRDGNVFALIGQVRRALIRAEHADVAEEFRIRALDSHEYQAVLDLCADYGQLEWSEEADDSEEEEEEEGGHDDD